MSNSNNDILLAISTPPFWHCGRTIRKNSIHTLLALTPAVILSLIQWGMPAARVMALAVVTAIVTEAVCQILMKQKLSQDNGTAAITGLLLAFLLPASAPWWLVIIASVCAMGIGRMAFGGYGANQVNATLVGWALVF
uniref:RnfABCDGE type electron transport complex subunit D n=1 Tax=uncultured Mailhella sp. TaxID=1981031 RepID=UPI0025CD368C